MIFRIKIFVLTALLFIIGLYASNSFSGNGQSPDESRRFLEGFIARHDPVESVGSSRSRSARILHRMGLADPEHAMKYFRRAIEMDPAFVPPYHSLGRALLDSGKGVHATVDEVLKLLDRSPETSAVRELRKKILVLV